MDPEEAWRVVLDSASDEVEAREAAVNLLVWLAKGGMLQVGIGRHHVASQCEAIIMGEFDRLDP